MHAFVGSHGNPFNRYPKPRSEFGSILVVRRSGDDHRNVGCVERRFFEATLRRLRACGGQLNVYCSGFAKAQNVAGFIEIYCCPEVFTVIRIVHPVNRAEAVVLVGPLAQQGRAHRREWEPLTGTPTRIGVARDDQCSRDRL